MKSNADCCLFKCAHTLSPTPVPYASVCVCELGICLLRPVGKVAFFAMLS